MINVSKFGSCAIFNLESQDVNHSVPSRSGSTFLHSAREDSISHYGILKPLAIYLLGLSHGDFTGVQSHLLKSGCSTKRDAVLN